MNMPAAFELPPEQLERLKQRFPAKLVALASGGQVSVRECGTAGAHTLPIVCLHGIGSGSASWMEMALILSQTTRVIAWDAPGYGSSTPLPMHQPRGADYAVRLHEMLDTLGISRCVLVGHSLGALMAAPATRISQGSDRFAALALISPASGYGAPSRESKAPGVRQSRLDALNQLGVAGMAAQRSARLVSDLASPLARAWVRWNMSRLHERGYRQAIELLCGGNVLADLPAPMLTYVACGTLDVVTPPAGCEEVALAAGVELHPINDAGHASYVEQPAAVAQWLSQVLEAAVCVAPAP